MGEPVSTSAALDPPPFGLRIGRLALDSVPSPKLFSNGSPLIRDPLCGIDLRGEGVPRRSGSSELAPLYPFSPDDGEISAGDSHANDSERNIREAMAGGAVKESLLAWRAPTWRLRNPSQFVAAFHVSQAEALERPQISEMTVDAV